MNPTSRIRREHHSTSTSLPYFDLPASVRVLEKKCPHPTNSRQVLTLRGHLKRENSIGAEMEHLISYYYSDLVP